MGKNVEEMIRVVDQQLDAYNARDIGRFLRVYANDVQIVELPNTLRMNGIEAVRDRYANLFATSPSLHAVVHNRTVVGNWVIDHETVTGASFPNIGEAVVAYLVQDGLISRVFVMKK